MPILDTPHPFVQAMVGALGKSLKRQQRLPIQDRLQTLWQWHYSVCTLDQDYVMQATGEVQVIQDDLENTYQRATS